LAAGSAVAPPWCFLDRSVAEPALQSNRTLQSVISPRCTTRERQVRHSLLLPLAPVFPASFNGPNPVASPPIHYANCAQNQALLLHVPAILHLGFLVREHGNLPGQYPEVQRTGNRRGLRRVRHRVND